MQYKRGEDYINLYQDLKKVNECIQNLYEKLCKVERQVGEEKAWAKMYKARCKGSASSSRATHYSVSRGGSSRRY